MPGNDENLRILTDHLLWLAAKQQHAVDNFDGANRELGDVAANCWKTHGIVCAPTNLAVADAQKTRVAAGLNLRKVSAELEERLKSAKDAYENTDSNSKRRIAQCEV